MPALYELAAEYRAALEELLELDWPDEVVRDTLEGLRGDLETKATNVAAFVRNLEATAAAIHEAEEKMSTRRRAIEARAERIRAYLLAHMQACGITKIECPWFVIARRKNPPSVEIVDEAALPLAFLAQPPPPPPKPDKRAILEALKRGEDVPGARLAQGERVEMR